MKANTVAKGNLITVAIIVEVKFSNFLIMTKNDVFLVSSIMFI